MYVYIYIYIYIYHHTYIILYHVYPVLTHFTLFGCLNSRPLPPRSSWTHGHRSIGSLHHPTPGLVTVSPRPSC